MYKNIIVKKITSPTVLILRLPPALPEPRPVYVFPAYFYRLPLIWLPVLFYNCPPVRAAWYSLSTFAKVLLKNNNGGIGITLCRERGLTGSAVCPAFNLVDKRRNYL